MADGHLFLVLTDHTAEAQWETEQVGVLLVELLAHHKRRSTRFVFITRTLGRAGVTGDRPVSDVRPLGPWGQRDRLFRIPSLSAPKFPPVPDFFIPFYTP